MFKPKKCPPNYEYASLYGSGGSGNRKYSCDYIFREFHSRGCDPGPGRIRYTPKKGVRRVAPPMVKSRKQAKGAGKPFTWDERAGHQMWLDGKTDREIAEALGASQNTVGNARRRKWMKEG